MRQLALSSSQHFGHALAHVWQLRDSIHFTQLIQRRSDDADYDGSNGSSSNCSARAWLGWSTAFSTFILLHGACPRRQRDLLFAWLAALWHATTAASPFHSHLPQLHEGAACENLQLHFLVIFLGLAPFVRLRPGGRGLFGVGRGISWEILALPAKAERCLCAAHGFAPPMFTRI